MRQTNRKLNKKKVILVLLILIIIILICIFISRTFSRYQSQATGEAAVDVAFLIVSDTIQDYNVVLENLEPGSTDECTFSVSNNNGTLRTVAPVEYDVIVTATTNLPLTYQLYEKTDSGEVEVTGTEDIVTDDDGTYYKTITYTGFEFGFAEDETTEFVLKATFPDDNNDAEFSDLVECVNLQIDAKQKISE